MFSITPSINRIGIQLFPQPLPDFSKGQSFQIGIPNNFDAIAYPSVNYDWIPLAGFVPAKIQQVNIVLKDSIDHIDAFDTVPPLTSTTGQLFFRAKVRSPVTYGLLDVVIIHDCHSIKHFYVFIFQFHF